jgi:glucose-1-phosphate cytidylyltransferase
MIAVILAGGFGTRLSEETDMRPKPMIEIGGKPILWHIMNIYSTHGINEFIIAAGYKAEVIKEYFLNFYAINNDITIDLATGNTIIHSGNQPNWKVHIIDTGLYTQTGGRLKMLRRWLEKEEIFMFTYGDGVADIDLNALLAFHKSHGKLATVTTVRSPARFGRIVVGFLC